MPTIGILAAGTFALFALGMVLPLLVAILDADWRAAEAIFLVAIAYAFFASVTILALSPRTRTLNRAGVFTAAAAIWVSLVIAATPVFILVEGQSLVRAVFEATSAVVTLGTTLRAPQDISVSMAFYRGTSAWLGGLATLALAVYVLGPYQVGGTPNANLRLVQHARTEMDPRVLRTLRSIFLPYAALTIACALLLVLMRVPVDDAIIVAMSMLSTNGFVPHQTGASVLNNIAAETVMIIFMLAGATSIIWHRMIAERKWIMARDEGEGGLYLVAVSVLAVLALLGSLFNPSELHSQAQHAFNMVFDVIATATTTGITHDRRAGVGLPFELILLIVFVGGCSYSTAGGIKAFRLGVMLRHLGNELNRLVYPNAILRDDVQYDDKPREVAKAVWSAFFLAVLTLTIAILYFAAVGYGLPEAMALASGAFSQVGNLVTEAMASTGSPVTDSTLIGITILTVIARIEILVVLAALSGNRWRIFQ